VGSNEVQDGGFLEGTSVLAALTLATTGKKQGKWVSLEQRHKKKGMSMGTYHLDVAGGVSVVHDLDHARLIPGAHTEVALGGQVQTSSQQQLSSETHAQARAEK
jgi:hypothetical protein